MWFFIRRTLFGEITQIYMVSFFQVKLLFEIIFSRLVLPSLKYFIECNSRKGCKEVENRKKWLSLRFVVAMEAVCDTLI